jgi:hypothetical protein
MRPPWRRRRSNSKQQQQGHHPNDQVTTTNGAFAREKLPFVWKVTGVHENFLLPSFHDIE